MYTLTKEFRFEAAHQLVGHDGKCARLHGHSWKGRVIIQGPATHGHGPKEGMLVDFGDIKKLLDPIVEQYLDHHHLNETLCTKHPTSEYVACWLYAFMSREVNNSVELALCRLVAVEIDETCTSSCRFDEGRGCR